MSDSSESSRRLTIMSDMTGSSSEIGEAADETEQSSYVYGIQMYCWCGELIVLLTSRTEANPFRRFYGCNFAAEQKLRKDKHVFKWMDEAYLDELKKITRKLAKLDEDMIELRESMENGMHNAGRMEVGLFNLIHTHSEVVEWRMMKKMMLMMLFVVITMVGLVKAI